MNLRPVWGISLTGLIACTVVSGCGKGGGYVMDYGKGGASSGQGGAPPNDGDASDPESGSDDGANGTDANRTDASSTDANTERGSDEPSDATADTSADSMRGHSDAASDTSDASDASTPGDAARLDGSTEAPRGDASDDRTADRSEPADVAADRPRSDAILPPPPSCVERCNDSTECMPVLPIADFECDLTTHRCVACRNDEACVAMESGWVLGCTTAAGCGFAGDACVTVNGAGRCAFTTASCGGAFPDTISATVFGTSNMVSVCGIESSKCIDGRCVDRCGPTNTCSPERGGRLCNAGTGRCECTDDIHCAGGIGVSKCNKATGQCECAGNADCIGVDDVDVCLNGKCGCSKVDVCTRAFTGTTVTCE